MWVTVRKARAYVWDRQRLKGTTLASIGRLRAGRQIPADDPVLKNGVLAGATMGSAKAASNVSEPFRGVKHSVVFRLFSEKTRAQRLTA